MEMFFSGRHLESFVAVLNGMQSPFVPFVPGDVLFHNQDGDMVGKLKTKTQLTFEFRPTRGWYVGNYGVLGKLVDMLPGLRWSASMKPIDIGCDRKLKTKTWWRDDAGCFWLKTYENAKDSVPRFGEAAPTREELVQASREFRKRGDDLALHDDGLLEARIQYRLAGYMLRKDAFTWFLGHRAHQIKRTPEPDIRELVLEIWLAASKLSARLDREPEQEWLHYESMTIAEHAYHISRRCIRPKINPELQLRIKLQYADVLQEAQRHFVRGLKFAPAESYDMIWFTEGQRRQRRPNEIPVVTRFNYAQTPLQSAADKYPDYRDIQEQLATCKGLRAITGTRERTL
jgi:hypothetical protein